MFERQQLLTQQVEDMQLLMPDRVLDSLGKKTVALIANLFILPPSVADVAITLTILKIVKRCTYPIR